jgi:lysozyme
MRCTDISRYQVVTDWKALSTAIGGVFMRCTVGDYYTDTSFASHWSNAKNVGLPCAPYHVIAPADVAMTRKITAKAQMDLFFKAMDGKSPDMPVVLDCELSRNQTKDYITALIAECIALASNHFGKRPIIYTRKTWFDYFTNPHPEFKTCDLFAARYATTLTGPWSDGYYKFRDWTEWKFWQWSDTGTLPGITGAVDMDWFNGDAEDFKAYLGSKTLEQRITILEREAALRGWNLD